MAAQSTTPSPQQLKDAGKVSVADAQGQTHTFESLLRSSASQENQVQWPLLVVFVRHFHCGACIKYLQSLFGHPRAKEARIVVIGHGSTEMIPRYTELTGSSRHGNVRIYTDQGKQLYHALGVTKSNLSANEDPKYFGGTSYGKMVVESLVEMVGSGRLAWKGGDFSQLGAEFVVLDGKSAEEGNIAYAHYMDTTNDHTEVDELLAAAGLQSK